MVTYFILSTIFLEYFVLSLKSPLGVLPIKIIIISIIIDGLCHKSPYLALFSLRDVIVVSHGAGKHVHEQLHRFLEAIKQQFFKNGYNIYLLS